MDQPTQHAYRDPSSLARWLRVGLIAFLALSVVQLAQGLSLFLFLASVKSGGFHSRDALVSMAHAVDFRTLILARVTLALLLSNAVLYFVWLYRSNTNVRALGAPGLGMSPGWAIGWYFIPFANLFMPPRNMSELFKASRNPAAWQQQKGTALVGWWWACWLTANIAAEISAMFMMLGRGNVDGLQIGTIFHLIEFLLNIPAVLLLMAIISRIRAAQTAASQTLVYA